MQITQEDDNILVAERQGQTAATCGWGRLGFVLPRDCGIAAIVAAGRAFPSFAALPHASIAELAVQHVKAAALRRSGSTRAEGPDLPIGTFQFGGVAAGA